MITFQEFITEKNDPDFKYVKASSTIKTGKGHTIVGHTWTGPEKDKKGANIIKHKDTNKFFAAGGSSTKEGQQFDTPEEAAKDYHTK